MNGDFLMIVDGYFEDILIYEVYHYGIQTLARQLDVWLHPIFLAHTYIYIYIYIYIYVHTDIFKPKAQVVDW